jgi:hypothetical protein
MAKTGNRVKRKHGDIVGLNIVLAKEEVPGVK